MLLLLFLSAGSVAPPGAPTEIVPSGGYGFGAYDKKTAKKRREREELAQEIERLEAHLVETGSLKQSEVDAARIAALVNEYGQLSDLPNRARRAFAYAERARTEISYQLALREIERLKEDEETALLLFMILD